MKSTTIKPIENGSGFVKVLKFSMILINYEMEMIDTETACCRVQHGRLIIDTNQYDFKIIDDDAKFLQFFLPLKLAKGLSYSDIFNPYIEALVSIDDENTKIDPMMILEKLEKEMVTIVSLSKVKIPLRKLNRDHDILWKSKKPDLDTYFLKIPFNMIYRIGYQYEIENLYPSEGVSFGPYTMIVENTTFDESDPNACKIWNMLIYSKFAYLSSSDITNIRHSPTIGIIIPQTEDSRNKMSIVKKYVKSNYRNKSFIILSFNTSLNDPNDENSIRRIDGVTIDSVVLQ